jgi:abhydrolase domain-containing protein 17
VALGGCSFFVGLISVILFIKDGVMVRDSKMMLHVLHVLWVIVQVILLLWGGLALFALLFAPSMLYHPPPPQYHKQPALITLTTAHGDNIVAVEKINKAARYTVLISHGNAEDLGALASLIDSFAAHGFSVIAYDYPGYGYSSGRPSEASTFAAANAVYHYLKAVRHVPDQQIIVFGRSLGSGMAYHLAAQHPVAGMIIEGGFTSAFRVMTQIALLPFDYYDNIDLVPAIKCPVLLIHASDDEVIPYWHAQVMADLFQDQATLYRVSGARHNNVVALAKARYWQEIVRWVKNSLHSPDKKGML